MSNASESLARNLAANIEALRRSRQLSQNQLALQADVPRSTIAHLESGEGNPSLLNLARVAGALQVSIEELLAAPRSRIQLRRASELPAVRRAQGNAWIFKLLPEPIPGTELDRMELEPGA